MFDKFNYTTFSLILFGVALLIIGSYVLSHAQNSDETNLNKLLKEDVYTQACAKSYQVAALYCSKGSDLISLNHASTKSIQQFIDMCKGDIILTHLNDCEDSDRITFHKINNSLQAWKNELSNNLVPFAINSYPINQPMNSDNVCSDVHYNIRYGCYILIESKDFINTTDCYYPMYAPDDKNPSIFVDCKFKYSFFELNDFIEVNKSV